MRTRRTFALVLLGFIISAALQWVPAQDAPRTDAPRTIEVHAKRFTFTPSEITLQVGETVKLHLTSDDVTHELVIPDLHVAQEINKGKPVDVTIVADKAGDFPGMCGHFCGSGHGSMTFAVHVKGN
jgi:cytochrome c oxidase subunit 2